MFPEAKEQIDELIRRRSRQGQEEGRLPRGVLWWMVSRRVIARVDAIFDTPVDELLGHGWRTLEALQVHLDGQPFTETVGEHTITTEHTHHLEVEIDGWDIGTLDLAVEMVTDIGSVALIGKDGHLEEAQLGGCLIEAKLECKTVIYDIVATIPVELRPIPIDLPGRLVFSHPIPILDLAPIDPGRDVPSARPGGGGVKRAQP